MNDVAFPYPTVRNPDLLFPKHYAGLKKTNEISRTITNLICQPLMVMKARHLSFLINLPTRVISKEESTSLVPSG